MTEKAKNKVKEKRQNWYFTFGSGQVHDGCFISFFGTHEEARKKMFASFDNKWSMQYSQHQWDNPKESNIRFNNLDPKTKPTMAEVWGWKKLN